MSPLFKDPSAIPKSKLIHLLPLVLSKSTLHKSNMDLLVNWMVNSDYLLRQITFPSLSIALRRRDTIIEHRRHVVPIEVQTANWLSNASRFSAQSAATVSFIKLTATKPQPITEHDGSISQDFFTILNITQQFTEDQLFNIQSFSMLYSWIHTIYCKNKVVAPNTAPTKIDPELKKSVVAYCLRVIEQSKLTPDADVGAGFAEMKEIIIIEAVRILDLICEIDNEMIPQIFPVIIKLSNAQRFDQFGPTGISLSQFTSQQQSFQQSQSQGGHLYLAVLQFLLNHGEAVVYDSDSIFRNFLENYVGSKYYNTVISFEILQFFIKNKAKILSTTNLFSTYFPPLLKLFAWNPEYHEETKQLLPAFVGPSTFMELFHTLTDLPLVTAALIRMSQSSENSGSSSSMSSLGLTPSASSSNLLSTGSASSFPSLSNIPGSTGSLSSLSLSAAQSASNSETSRYRVLYNYLLRNESGVTVNWWGSSTTHEILQSFCKETVITSRIKRVANHVPSILELYLDVVIAYADERFVFQLVPVIFQRLEQLFPLPDFQQNVRSVMISKILAIFEKYPWFVVELKVIHEPNVRVCGVIGSTYALQA
eukprot:TRINITY_DN6633_c0_g1_i1.p1 TRINITY_DN6633_c0_g1~~TRINITY_DN6633_c0_g1_i1.p1  ORF type:complete len:681 (-),score=91.62 TRINITY_DN6633_c0_g1_i1:599-2377(-)